MAILTSLLGTTMDELSQRRIHGSLGSWGMLSKGKARLRLKHRQDVADEDVSFEFSALLVAECPIVGFEGSITRLKMSASVALGMIQIV